MVVTNESSNTVSVFRNTSSVVGEISYSAKLDYETEEGPISVAIDDLNGDGKQDLVVTHKYNTISIFRNTTPNEGTISFANRLNYTTGGESSYAVATGDLDGDGKIDLVIGSRYSSNISIFLNANSGPDQISYSSKLDYYFDGYPYFISIGDLDGDGKVDLVVAQAETDKISVIRNTSSGIGLISFADKIDYNTGQYPRELAIGDLDGDNKIDIAVVNVGNKKLSIFKNISEGAGSINFDSKLDYNSSGYLNSIAIGDLDGDGKVDCVVTLEDNAISIFRNTSTDDGIIRYDEKVVYATGLNPYSLSIGDLDGDGKSDLAVANSNSNTISIFMNAMGNISLSNATDITAFSFINQTAAADLGTGTVEIEISSVTDITNLIATFTLSSGATAKIGSTDQESGVTGNDFSQPVIYIITAEDGVTTQDWVVTVTENGAPLSTESDVILFSFPQQTAQATIDDNTIHIQVAKGSDITSLVASYTLSSGAAAKTGSTEQVSGVTSNDFSQPITYTITAEDGETTKDWVVIVIVAGAPVISNINYSDSYALTTGGSTITAEVSSDQDISAVLVYHKPITETNYDQSTMSLIKGKYTYSFSDEDFGGLGLSFFVSAEDIDFISTLTPHHSIYTINRGDSEGLPNITSSNDPLDYSMIAMPYQTESVANTFDNLGIWNASEMLLAHHDGSAEYKMYPTDFTKFEPGKGYWFLTSRNTDFPLGGGKSVQANENNPFSIQLRANDWNMIGNPYPFHIDWQEVIDHNANYGITVEKLVTFKNRQFNADQTIMNKYDGALLYSSSDVEIKIPISAKNNSSGRLSETRRTNDLQNFGLGDWKMGLNLRNETMEYNVSAFGMNEDAQVGRDAYDWGTLPRLSSYLDLSFSSSISRSVVPIVNEFTWDFTVNSNIQGERTTLSWGNAELKNTDYTMILLNIETQKVIDMLDVASYSFNFDGGIHPFKIFYAQKNKMAEYLTLDRNFIGQPYPNPFNDKLVVPVSISKSSATVSINIYNILGKEVYQSSKLNKPEGYHEIIIDLAEETKINIKSGTYLMQVTVESDEEVYQVNKRIIYTN